MRNQSQTNDDSSVRCSFCGKSRDDVRTILTSRESAICDECVATAMDILSRQPGHFFVRIAYFIFRCVASLGVILRRPRTGTHRAILAVCTMSLLATTAWTEPLVMPRDLVAYGRVKGCEQVRDFYDRPGVLGPPYVYGYLPGPLDDSAVFWCQTGPGAKRQVWLVVKRDRAVRGYDCAEKVRWPLYPGGLSIERAGVASDEFFYLAEWDQPKRVVPGTTQLIGHAIQSEYDGLEAMLYCYRGEWIIRVRH